MDISIIIVSWNCKEHLARCLQSILASECKLQMEVIVVDNDSMDGTCEMVKADFPDVILIESSNNEGFAKGCNRGIRASKGRTIMLLNPDTTVPKRAIDKMATFLESRDDIGMVGPREVLPDGTFDSCCCRTLPSLFSHFLYLSGLAVKYPNSKLVTLHLIGEKNPWQQMECEAISGSCMMVKRTILDKVGLLDERFFMYGEDIDLCFRMRKAGWKIWYYPDVEIVHACGESAKLVENQMRIVNLDSIYKYFAKNRGFLYALAYRGMVICSSLFWLSVWLCAWLVGYKKGIVQKEVIPKYSARLHWALTGAIPRRTRSEKALGVKDLVNRSGAE